MKRYEDNWNGYNTLEMENNRITKHLTSYRPKDNLMLVDQGKDDLSEHRIG